jgi:hypothetical protein
MWFAIALAVSWYGAVFAQESTKDVSSAPAAVKGEMPDPTGEVYGVVGVANSPRGAGLGAMNTTSGPDLVLDGSANGGQTDALISQSGVDRPSPNPEAWVFENTGGGGMTLEVDGVEVVTVLTDQDTLAGLGCMTWQVAKWNGSQWVCEWDWDSLWGLSCAAGEVAEWDGTSWMCGSDDQGVVLASSIVVSPVGDWLQNGTALLDAIAALPPGVSAVHVEPGVYDLGSSALVLPGYVTVSGVSGRTTITSSVCDYPTDDLPTTATIVLGSLGQLSDLQVRNGCADPAGVAVAVLSPDVNPQIDNVRMEAWADAGTCYGLFSIGDITVDRGIGFSNCPGGTDYGFFFEPNVTTGGVVLTNSAAIATYGGAALHVADPGARLHTVEVAAAATGAGLEIAGDGIWVEGVTAEGGSGGPAISVTSGNDIAIFDTIAVGMIVVDGSGSDVVFNGCGADPVYGGAPDLDVTGDGYAKVMSSAFNNVTVGPGTVRIGASQVLSVTELPGGFAKCAGVWDSGFNFHASSCP